MVRAVLCFLCLTLAGSAVAQRIVHVSPSGDDANTGTPSEPWRSIDRVNAESWLPGDSILFEGGATHPGELSFGSDDAGTPAAPVLVSSFGGGRATLDAGSGTAIDLYNAAGFEISELILRGDWDADAQAGNDGDGISVYSDLEAQTRLEHLVIRNVEVFGFAGQGLNIGAWPADGTKSGFSAVLVEDCDFHDNGDGGVSSWGYWDPGSGDHAHRDIVVRRCRFFRNRGLVDKGGHSGSGIVLGDVNGALIERSEAFENGDLCNHGGGGPVGIWAWDATRVTIQFNEAHHNRTGASSLDGGGFDLDGGVTDSVVQYNYSHDNDGAGYLSWQFGGAPPLLGRNVFRYNVSENDGRAHSYGGIYIGGGGELRDNEFHDNTIFVSPAPSGSPAGITIKGIGTGNAFRNNLIVTTGGVELIDANSAPAPDRALFQGNAYFAGADPADFRIRWGSATHADLASFRGEGQESEGGRDTGWAGDPLLSNPGAGGTIGDPSRLSELAAYRLQPGSPLVDAGLDLATLFGVDPGLQDFFGSALPQGAAFDIGAHELASCSVPGAVGPTLRVSRSGGDLGLTWTDVADAIEYRVQHAARADGAFDTTLGVADDGASGLTEPLPAGDLRFLLVGAVNACGEGPLR